MWVASGESLFHISLILFSILFQIIYLDLVSFYIYFLFSMKRGGLYFLCLCICLYSLSLIKFCYL